jgi:hypothetical protein
MGKGLGRVAGEPWSSFNDSNTDIQPFTPHRAALEPDQPLAFLLFLKFC